MASGSQTDKAIEKEKMRMPVARSAGHVLSKQIRCQPSASQPKTMQSAHALDL